MNLNLLTIIFAFAFANTVHSTPVTLEDYKIGTQNVLYNNHQHSFTVGSSKFDTDVRNAMERDTLPRDNPKSIRGGSYTGTGSEVEVIGSSQENCVQYAKRITGISRSIGLGGRYGVNSQEPRVGAIGVEKTRYHAVVIEKINGSSITITEANFYEGEITRRVLQRSEFLGFII